MNHWTKEQCEVIAKGFKTRREMRVKNYRAYDAARSKGWLNDIFNSLPNHGFAKGRLKNGSLTFEALSIRVKKHPTRTQFQKGDQSAYVVAWRNGWLDNLFKEHPNQGYSTAQVRDAHWQQKETSLAAARKCETKTEFQDNYRGAYAACVQNGWFDEATAHMQLLGTRYKRFVYSISNPMERQIYIGLSYNPKARYKKHRAEGTECVRNLINAGGVLQILSELLPRESAAELEAALVNKYRTEGWTVLNKIRAGGLGGNEPKHNFDECRTLATTVQTRSEFALRYPPAYQLALKHHWMDDLFKYHKEKGYQIKPPGYWTQARLQKLASCYRTRGEFAREHPSAYQTALQKGLVDELFADHPNQGYKTVPNGTWTKDKCGEVATECRDRQEMFENYPGGYDAATSNKWIDEIFLSHPNRGFRKTPKGTWTFEKVRDLAKECKTRSELKEKHPGAYAKAERKGWLNEIFKIHSDQGRISRPSGYWKDDTSNEAAKKCKSRSELKRRFWGAYDYLLKKGALHRLFPTRKVRGSR